MKKFFILANFLAVLSVSLISGYCVKAEQTVYRLYNKYNGEHLYTTDQHEKDILFTQHGWGYEGEAWYAPNPGQGTPVYRLYNAGLQNHLYTTDSNEVRILTSKHGWTVDNHHQPVFYSGGSATIYRVYNKGLRGLHHWTTDLNEYNTLPSHGWKQEGVKLYGERIGTAIQTQYYTTKNHSSAANQNSSATFPEEQEKSTQPTPQPPTVVPSGNHTIANTESNHTIEADVILTGSGTGYHAKLVMAAPDAAVSFGLQFDRSAIAPFAGKTAFLIENIASNNLGGQSYHRAKDYLGSLNTSYRLMLTLQTDGTYTGYVNGTEVIRGRNAVLANRSDIYLRVEGAARKTGDSITAGFSAIKLKQHGSYDATRKWLGTPQFNIANGIVTKMDGIQVTNAPSDRRYITNDVVFTGRLTGLPDYADWDTAGYFDKVSGLIQFIY